MKVYQETYEKLQKIYSVYGNQGDQFRTVFYDTAILATGVNQYNLFNSANGLNGVTKAQTNMESPAQMVKTCNFFVERIGLRLYAPSNAAPAPVLTDIVHDFMTVCGSSNIVLNMSSKQNVGEWPLITFLNTISLGVIEPIATVGAAYATASSMASTWYSVGTFDAQTAIPLLEQDTFGFVINQWDTTTTIPATLNGFRLKVELEGIVQRLK